MQQTETYKLNLIEMSDTFSPDPLNENAQKLEAALTAEADQRAAEAASLDERLAVIEGHKFVMGQYTGNNGTSTTQTVELGFTPMFVFVQGGGLFLYGTSLYGSVNMLKIVEGGFTVRDSNFNSNGTVYHYFAFV